MLGSEAFRSVARPSLQEACHLLAAAAHCQLGLELAIALTVRSQVWLDGSKRNEAGLRQSVVELL